jgi:hypothetical protein
LILKQYGELLQAAELFHPIGQLYERSGLVAYSSEIVLTFLNPAPIPDDAFLPTSYTLQSICFLSRKRLVELDQCILQPAVSQ